MHPKAAPEHVFISLGSNLGERELMISRAVSELQHLSLDKPLVSSLWETTPVDCPAGSAAFLNAVVRISARPDEAPESLLTKLQQIERVLGRQPKKVMNEARPIDLDIIAFGTKRRFTAELTIPHPRASQRRFVLEPLAEIAPELVLPGQTKTVTELLAQVPPDPGMRKLFSAR